MNSWTITNLNLSPHAPKILASTNNARAIALVIPAGESFDDHQVHESAWVTVIDGDVEITTSSGESVTGSTGLVVAFAPNERHAVHARSDARLLLLLTPWPGVGHPGAMTLEQKATPATTPPSTKRAPDRQGPLTIASPLLRTCALPTAVNFAGRRRARTVRPVLPFTAKRPR
jgi:quercetin dioxygenase-like cupin family protein